MFFSAESSKIPYHYLEVDNDKSSTSQNNGEIMLDKRFLDEQIIEINLDHENNDSIETV